MSTTAQVLGVLQQTGGFLTGVVPNPPAKAPAGVAQPVAAVISYVKWGVLIVIFLSALAGVGALAGGRVFGNHGASKIGVSMLVTAVGALVVYVGLYAFLSGAIAAAAQRLKGESIPNESLVAVKKRLLVRARVGSWAPCTAPSARSTRPPTSMSGSSCSTDATRAVAACCSGGSCSKPSKATP